MNELNAILVAFLWVSPGLVQTAPELSRREIQLRGGGTIEAEFGRIEVPENRAKPESRKISLAFLRVRSPLEKPGAPVFMLAGGPGGSSIEMLEMHLGRGGRMFQQWMGGDLVAIDQRGVGQSEPNLDSDTPYAWALDEPGDREKMLAVILKTSRQEAERWRSQGVDLSGYTTAESADDIDAVRQALGYGKVVLWGESYGSHLAMATIRRHGEHVVRAVLICPEGPDHTLKLPSHAQEGLERIAAMVKADSALSGSIPDFMAMLKSVLDGLETKPVIAEVDGTRVGISKFDVQRMLAHRIGRRQGGVDQTPAVVKAMADGNFSDVAAALLRERREDSIGSAMMWVMDSASGASPERLARVAREAKDCLLGDTANFPYPQVAEAWGAPDLGAEFRGPLRSEVPVLFIAGDLDTQTPVHNAKELMEHLPNAHLIVVENVGHDLPWGVPDVRQGWMNFLAGREVGVTNVKAPPIQFAPLD